MTGVKVGGSRPLFCLDSAAFAHGADLPPAQCLVPSAVTDEFQPGGITRRRLDTILAAGATVRDPTPESRAKVRQVALDAGNFSRLSKADIDVLAVALEAGATIVTDDYTVVDVARRMGIPSQTVATRGIEATMDWESRCKGCGRRFPSSAASRPCHVCGSEVRLSPRRQ
jgi:endoribonuclease Nob1